MSNTIGRSKDLNSSRKEALQGLLGSLESSSNAKLSAEQLQDLSKKINEILQDDTDRSLTPENQSSQLLNEEGDPIVDISELVDEASQENNVPSSVPEQDLVPFSLLPPDEKERRRRERDRILDLLEEEERLQQLQEERDAEEERKDAINKRKESAKAELEQLKAARELQKKMGKALVRQAKEAENRQGEDVHSIPQPNTSPVAKKSVSFVDAPPLTADGTNERTSARQADWGDVTPGRLRAQTRVALVSAAEAEKYPMKTRVVERHPVAITPSLYHSGADSDDESPSSGHPSPHVESNSSDEDKSPLSRNNSSDDEPLEEEFDYDAAQHHREIALEYHEKRHAIGAETAKVLGAHTLDRYDQHEALPLSHFRADRMAAVYDKSQNLVSTSIGTTVIPASRQKSLRNSVRLGKLENDQLVGGDSGESGSEDEAIREAIHMFQTGNIQNAGPDFEPSSMSNAILQNSDAAGSPTIRTSTTTYGTKQSRFKSARGGVIDRGTLANNDNRDNTQLQPAISGVVERGSSPSQRFPINRYPLRSPVTACKPAPPMIIDSSSSPMTSSTPTVVVPPSSPTRHRATTNGPCETQVGRPCVQSQVSPRDSSTEQRPVSKFMSERNKMPT